MKKWDIVKRNFLEIDCFLEKKCLKGKCCGKKRSLKDILLGYIGKC